MANHSCLILLAHGSPNPTWMKQFYDLEQNLKADLGPDKVFLSFMQYGKTTLLETVQTLAAKGMKEIRVLPLFMAPGNHIREDIPAQVDAVRSELPQVKVELLPPIGEHPGFMAFMQKLIKQTASSLAPA